MNQTDGCVGRNGETMSEEVLIRLRNARVLLRDARVLLRDATTALGFPQASSPAHDPLTCPCCQIALEVTKERDYYEALADELNQRIGGMNNGMVDDEMVDDEMARAMEIIQAGSRGPFIRGA